MAADSSWHRKRIPMPKEEWGVKRTCPTTGKRFYDLGRTPVVSPYTGEEVVVEALGRKPVSAPAAPVAKEKRPTATDKDRTEDGLLVDDDAEDLEIEDDLLEDEEDDNVALDDLADVADDEEDN